MSDTQTYPNESLYSALEFLSSRPDPYFPSPKNTPKRASVALIIWIKPTPESLPITSNTSARNLGEFFEQEWVRHGDPQVLFIKRATRIGDRWSAHIALPGGRRDPEDADDRETAERETREEIGLNLTKENSIFCGGLDQRLLRTSGTTIPLMVLCPYIYILTSPIMPTLTLQPTEIDSVHFVSLDLLLSPSSRTYEYANTSRRLLPKARPWVQQFLRVMMGDMKFAAIHLRPTNSVPPSAVYEQLHLWGLTLDVMTDLLDLLPPHSARKLWTFPTYSMPDIWFLTYLYTFIIRRKIRELNSLAADDTTISGPGRGRMNWIGDHLDGYFTSVRYAVYTSLALRTIFTAWLLNYFFQKLRSILQSRRIRA